jgi:hypothetical protein
MGVDLSKPAGKGNKGCAIVLLVMALIAFVVLVIFLIAIFGGAAAHPITSGAALRVAIGPALS